MDNIFQELIANNFSDLVGMTVDASIPVPEHIVNEFIKSTLRGNKKITECHAAIRGQNKICIILKTPLWPWPINLKLRLDKAVDFTGSPTAKASLENNILLGKLGALFKALPNGVNIHGNQVIVDIRSLLDTPEQKKMLDLVKAADVSTDEAKLILDIKIRVG